MLVRSGNLSRLERKVRATEGVHVPERLRLRERALRRRHRYRIPVRYFRRLRNADELLERAAVGDLLWLHGRVLVPGRLLLRVGLLSQGLHHGKRLRDRDDLLQRILRQEGVHEPFGLPDELHLQRQRPLRAPSLQLSPPGYSSIRIPIPCR